MYNELLAAWGSEPLDKEAVLEIIESFTNNTTIQGQGVDIAYDDQEVELAKINVKVK